MSLIGNRYEVSEKLGQGGMGEVFRGVDTLTQTPVAIKNLKGSISADSDVLERFRREGAALRELNHPNIVKMLNMIQEDDENFLIMEFIDGGDLSDWIKERGKLSVNEAIKLALELADALSRAHHVGIIHRDIKPANVLIAHDGTPRLTDFGVARIETEERLTGTGVAVGTLDYMPPEAINGEQVDVRGDIWAFGVLLYEMLTGERPFTAETTVSLLSNILTMPTPNLRDLCPEAPQDLQDLIELMLQKEPQQRLRSARQLGAALEAILRGEHPNLQRLDTPSDAIPPQVQSVEPTTSDHVTAPSSETMPPADKKLSPVWIVSILALLLIIGGGALAASGVLDSATESASETQAVVIEETPIPTNNPTPIAVAVSDSAPEGYEWVSVDEISLLMPSSWTHLNMDELIETVSNSLTTEEDSARLDAGIDFWQQQRSASTYLNWLSLQGIAVFIEDTGLILTEEMQDERVRGLAELADFDILDEINSIGLPGGTARQYFMDLDVNTLTMRLNIYVFQKNATQYMVLFGSRADRTDGIQPIIDAVIPSVRFTTSEDIQPEETSEVVADVPIPEGWKPVQGDTFSFAIPSEWLSFPTNPALLRSTIELIANAEYADSVLEAMEPFEIPTLFGIFSPESTVAGAVITLLSPDMTMEFVEAYFQTLQENLGEQVDAELISTETIILPAGRASRTISALPGSNGSQDYIGEITIIETPRGFYILSITVSATIYDEIKPELDTLAETFAVLPDSE